LSIALYIATCVLTLTGCETLTPPLPERPPIAGNLTSLCPPLTPLDDGTGAKVLRKVLEVSKAYYDCANKHEGLANAVK
jgi:hypothetical protein